MAQPTDDAVRGYASEVVGCPADAITAVTRFEHGNRHSVYRVTCGLARDVVVRVALAGDAAEVARAGREAAVLRVVGRTAAPDLLDFSPAGAWFDAPAMCLEHVCGPSRDLVTAAAAELERLGALVAWVHQRPLDSLNGSLGQATTVTAYAEDRLRAILGTLAWARDPLPDDLQRRLRHAADRLATNVPSFEAAGTLSLLHGDIGPGNVLWNPGPCLIDWEYTRLGDPADEIAYCFDQNALTAAQRAAFWAGYARGLGDASGPTAIAERVGWWEPITLLGSALWWVERWIRRSELESDAGVPREPAYYFERVTARIDRLETFLSEFT